MPEEIPCQPSGLMEVQGGCGGGGGDLLDNLSVQEKMGELGYADKNRKLPCVIRCWRDSSELPGETHVQRMRAFSERLRRNLCLVDDKKNRVMGELRPLPNKPVEDLTPQ